MKKLIKNNLFGFILGAIIFGSIGVAASQLFASDISYNNTTVDRALDDLYTRAYSRKNTFCLYMSGTRGAVGSKYLCDPGDGVARYFYILKVETNDVKLIMDKNLSDEIGNNKLLTWNDAMSFIETNNIDTSWKNVKNVDLPDAQDIANAGGISNFDVTTATSREYYFGGSQSASANYAWLFNYLRGCSKYGSCTNQYPDTDGNPWGYYTKDLRVNDSANVWVVNTNGFLDSRPANEDARGVRPVITVTKNNIN